MSKENQESLIQDIKALQSGDRSAFEKFYYAFGPKLLAFTSKLVPNKDDAREILQEVFLKLWERRQYIDPQQQLDGYLFMMAKNLVYNKARRQVMALAYGQYLTRRHCNSANSTQEHIDYQELSHLLEETCTGMPPTRKQVFVMSRMQGLSNSEIAERLQTSSSNIENHINKALNTLRKKLKR